MTAWIRFKVEIEDGDGSIIRVSMDNKVFNSQIAQVFQRSDLNEIIDEMFAYMKAQVENPVLANSRFAFDRVLFLNVSFHQLNLT